jgi:hypothetical protein
MTDADEQVGHERIVDLGPWLDGTWTAPQPTVGAVRADGHHNLYAGRWHTLIGLTGTGKSWLAITHAVAELAAGNTVIYCHFEETSPSGTIGRLRALDVPDDVIRERFIWLDCSRRWPPADFAFALSQTARATLVILDGINAACGHQGWPVDKPETVGEYRAMFVNPPTRGGATVLSLGHPVKARDRQQERHGFGSTAFLDEVDGVAFRLEASKRHPIRKGALGYAELYTVKDRYGEVERHGEPIADREPGWYHLASLRVDSTQTLIEVELRTPMALAKGSTPIGANDPIDDLVAAILTLLRSGNGAFASKTMLVAQLRAAGVRFNNDHVLPALMRLSGGDHPSLVLEEAARGGISGALAGGDLRVVA